MPSLSLWTMIHSVSHNTRSMCERRYTNPFMWLPLPPCLYNISHPQSIQYRETRERWKPPKRTLTPWASFRRLFTTQDTLRKTTGTCLSGSLMGSLRNMAYLLMVIWHTRDSLPWVLFSGPTFILINPSLHCLITLAATHALSLWYIHSFINHSHSKGMFWLYSLY